MKDFARKTMHFQVKWRPWNNPFIGLKEDIGPMSEKNLPFGPNQLSLFIGSR